MDSLKAKQLNVLANTGESKGEKHHHTVASQVFKINSQQKTGSVSLTGRVENGFRFKLKVAKIPILTFLKSGYSLDLMVCC